MIVAHFRFHSPSSHRGVMGREMIKRFHLWGDLNESRSMFAPTPPPKLSRMILPQLEAGTMASRSSACLFFDDNTFVLRHGESANGWAGRPMRDAADDATIRAGAGIGRWSCAECDAVGMGRAEPGDATSSIPSPGCGSAASPTSGCAMGNMPDQVITNF